MSRIKPKSALERIALYRPDTSGTVSANPIRLSVNEGALGPSPKAIEALRQMGDRLHRYPEQIDTDLVAAIADYSGLDPARILPSNGSDELIGLLATAYCNDGDEAIITQYGFLVFRQSVTVAGGVPVIAPDEGLTVSVDAILNLISPRTKLIFLANPNNPTGTMIPRADIERLIANVPDHTIIVLDSAYAEYLDGGDQDYTDGAEYVEKYDNVVMLRTFSKIFGLGALRLGWGYFPPEIYSTLASIRGAFSVNAAAAIAGSAAIADKAFYQRSIDHNRHWMPRMQASILQAGFTPLPSVANFFLIRFASLEAAAVAHQFMIDRDILLRRMTPYGLPDCLRMSIGNDAEMELVTSAFKDLSHVEGMGIAPEADTR